MKNFKIVFLSTVLVLNFCVSTKSAALWDVFACCGSCTMDQAFRPHDFYGDDLTGVAAAYSAADYDTSAVDDDYPMQLWAQVQTLEWCDAVNRRASYFYAHNGKRIEQPRCLYQAYPVLPENYCGYYAAYFARCLLENQRERRLCDALNDRTAFNSFLDVAVMFVRQQCVELEASLAADGGAVEGELSSAHISAEGVRYEFYNAGNSMLTPDLIKGIIGLSCEEFQDRIFIEGYSSKVGMDDAIKKFKANVRASDLCFILHAGKFVDHWIVVLVRKGKGLIIADSMNADETSDPKVEAIYDGCF